MLSREEGAARIRALAKRGAKARRVQKARPAAKPLLARAQLSLSGRAVLQYAVIPLRTVSEANAHEHWRARKKRVDDQHRIVSGILTFPAAPKLPCTIKLTRIGRGLMDSDNAIGSLKHVRDAVAKWLGVDDGPSGPVTWVYGEQERGEYAVRIEVLP